MGNMDFLMLHPGAKTGHQAHQHGWSDGSIMSQDESKRPGWSELIRQRALDMFFPKSFKSTDFLPQLAYNIYNPVTSFTRSFKKINCQPIRNLWPVLKISETPSGQIWPNFVPPWRHGGSVSCVSCVSWPLQIATKSWAAALPGVIGVDAERSSQDEAEIRCPAAGRFVEMAILLKAVEKGDAIDRFDKIAPVKMMMQLAKNGYGYSGNGWWSCWHTRPCGNLTLLILERRTEL